MKELNQMNTQMEGTVEAEQKKELTKPLINSSYKPPLSTIWPYF